MAREGLMTARDLLHPRELLRCAIWGLTCAQDVHLLAAAHKVRKAAKMVVEYGAPIVMAPLGINDPSVEVIKSAMGRLALGPLDDSSLAWLIAMNERLIKLLERHDREQQNDERKRNLERIEFLAGAD
jgi:hypothetical protein